MNSNPNPSPHLPHRTSHIANRSHPSNRNHTALSVSPSVESGLAGSPFRAIGREYGAEQHRVALLRTLSLERARYRCRTDGPCRTLPQKQASQTGAGGMERPEEAVYECTPPRKQGTLIRCSRRGRGWEFKKLKRFESSLPLQSEFSMICMHG